MPLNVTTKLDFNDLTLVFKETLQNQQDQIDDHFYMMKGLKYSYESQIDDLKKELKECRLSAQSNPISMHSISMFLYSNC